MKSYIFSMTLAITQYATTTKVKARVNHSQGSEREELAKSIDATCANRLTQRASTLLRESVLPTVPEI